MAEEKSKPRGPRSSRSGRNSSIPTKIYVGNLPESCRRVGLEKAFEKYGKVTECDIVRNYAFVHMENADEARKAVAELNESDFDGNTLSVQLSTSKVRQKPGMGNDVNECYRCGKTGHWSRNCPMGPRRPHHQDDESDFFPGAGPPPPGFGRYPDMPMYPRGPYDPYYRERAYGGYGPYGGGDPYGRPMMRAPREPHYGARARRDPYARPPPDYYAARQSSPPPDYVRAYYEDRGYPAPRVPAAARY